MSLKECLLTPIFYSSSSTLVLMQQPSLFPPKSSPLASEALVTAFLLPPASLAQSYPPSYSTTCRHRGASRTSCGFTLLANFLEPSSHGLRFQKRDGRTQTSRIMKNGLKPMLQRGGEERERTDDANVLTKLKKSGAVEALCRWILSQESKIHTMLNKAVRRLLHMQDHVSSLMTKN